MADTYQVNNDAHYPDVYFSREMYTHHCALALWNGADAVVDVVDVWNDFLSGANTTEAFDSATSPMHLHRCTAVSGGTDLGYSKHDTGSANLPSQVLLRGQPTAVTVTDTFRAIVDPPGFFSNTSQDVTGSLGQGMTDAGNGGPLKNVLWTAGDSGAVIQPIVLREGQGLLLHSDYAESAYREGLIVFRNAATGATYQIGPTAYFSQNGDKQNMLAIFNGVGSAVVLEILQLKTIDVGVNTNLRNAWRLFKFYLPPRSGTVLSARKYDTAGATLPAGLALYQDAVVEAVANEEQLLASNSPWSGSDQIQTYQVMQDPISRIGCVRSLNTSRHDRTLSLFPFRRQIVRELIDWNPLRLRRNEGIGIAYGLATNVLTTSNWASLDVPGPWQNQFAPNAVLQNTQWWMTFGVTAVAPAGSGGLLTNPGMAGGMRG